MMFNKLGIVAIALVTTVITLSLTHYLLNRPWCIRLDAGGEQTVLYGDRTCIREARTVQPVLVHSNPQAGVQL